MQAPTVPLTVEQRELIDFCEYFRTVEGYFAEFEKNYLLLKHSTRKIRGKKKAAYELTEQLHCHLFPNKGRRYKSPSQFTAAKARFYKTNGKQS